MEFLTYIMPVSLLLMAWKMRGSGVVQRFINAGAISESTARKPASVDPKMHIDFIRSAARRGALIDVGNGRYYANVERVQRIRRRRRFLLGSATVLTIAVTLLLWHPWT